jgi:hypothetical protein
LEQPHCLAQKGPSLSQIPRTLKAKNKEIVIFGAARIAQLVGNVTRGHEAIACLEHKDLISDDDLQLSGGYIVRFIFTRVRVARHAYPGREAHFHKAICPSGI